MPEFKLDKLTDCKWLNLYDVTYTNKHGSPSRWAIASRKHRPITDACIPDAVVIVPFVDTPDGRKLVVTKEFRVAIWDYEYGFPAGLIDSGCSIEKTIQKELKEETGLDLVKILHISSPIYSSAGLSDESCCMAIVQVEGKISADFLEDSEQIETFLMTPEDIKKLLASGNKISAKAWGLFYHYAKTNKIE
ncbi:MAG: NUDIX hydrolase [Phycisphaerae bacterium]